jgi:hypothetical protein
MSAFWELTKCSIKRLTANFKVTIFNTMIKFKRKKSFKRAFGSISKLLLKNGFVPLGYGRHKATFGRGDIVFRVPRNMEAVYEMFLESEMAKTADKGIFYFGFDKAYLIRVPRMRQIYIKGIPVQMMEKLIPYTRDEIRGLKDKWLDDLAKGGDGRQVGRNKYGITKAYDFADIAGFVNHEHSIKIEAGKKYEKVFDSFSDVHVSGEYLDKKGLIRSLGVPGDGVVEQLAPRLAALSN